MMRIVTMKPGTLERQGYDTSKRVGKPRHKWLQQVILLAIDKHQIRKIDKDGQRARQDTDGAEKEGEQEERDLEEEEERANQQNRRKSRRRATPPWEIKEYLDKIEKLATERKL